MGGRGRGRLRVARTRDVFAHNYAGSPRGHPHARQDHRRFRPRPRAARGGVRRPVGRNGPARTARGGLACSGHSDRPRRHPARERAGATGPTIARDNNRPHAAGDGYARTSGDLVLRLASHRPGPQWRGRCRDRNASSPDREQIRLDRHAATRDRAIVRGAAQGPALPGTDAAGALAPG